MSITHRHALTTILLPLLLLVAAAACAADTGGAAVDGAVATFAGGCFWCVEADFEKLDGVLEAVSGYTGGHVDNPTYEQVSAGGTGHAEAVRVVYDPSVVTYEELVEFFWRHVDPTTPDRQFCDRGDQYRPEIFVHDAEQRRIAEASKARLEETKPFDDPIRVAITDAGPFYDAEAYHQQYYETHALRYKYYRWNCGRDQRLEELWGGER
jgi:peptide-methionine (S)-S-oxide reductase